MKIDPIRVIIALGLAFFIGWGYYAMAANSDDALSVGAVMGVEMLLIGIGAFSIRFNECPRSGVVIRVTCYSAALVFLVLNAIFARAGVNVAFFVINGVLALLLLLVLNSVYRANQ